MTSANHDRDVVALGEMEHQTAKLFEPQASFWPSRNEHSATVEGIERRHAPVQLLPHSCFILDAGLRRHDKGIFNSNDMCGIRVMSYALELELALQLLGILSERDALQLPPLRT